MSCWIASASRQVGGSLPFLSGSNRGKSTTEAWGKSMDPLRVETEVQGKLVDPYPPLSGINGGARQANGSLISGSKGGAKCKAS